MQAVAPVPSRTRPVAPAACGAIASRGGIERRLDLARVREKLRAGRGRRHAAADALDQLDAEALLELAHLQAHRRLADAEARRRGRKAPQRDHVREGADLVEIEPAHLKVFLMQCITDQSLLICTAGRQFGGLAAEEPR